METCLLCQSRNVIEYSKGEITHINCSNVDCVMGKHSITYDEFVFEMLSYSGVDMSKENDYVSKYEAFENFHKACKHLGDTVRQVVFVDSGASSKLKKLVLAFGLRKAVNEMPQKQCVLNEFEQIDYSSCELKARKGKGERKRSSKEQRRQWGVRY